MTRYTSEGLQYNGDSQQRVISSILDNAEDRGRLTEIWLADRFDGAVGTGTPEDPYHAAGMGIDGKPAFDTFLRNLSPEDYLGLDMNIHVLPGIYVTEGAAQWPEVDPYPIPRGPEGGHGFYLRDGWKLIGHGYPTLRICQRARSGGYISNGAQYGVFLPGPTMVPTSHGVYFFEGHYWIRLHFATEHGFRHSDTVTIAGTNGSPDYNGNWICLRVDDKIIDLVMAAGVDYTAATVMGTARRTYAPYYSDGLTPRPDIIGRDMEVNGFIIDSNLTQNLDPAENIFGIDLGYMMSGGIVLYGTRCAIRNCVAINWGNNACPVLSITDHEINPDHPGDDWIRLTVPGNIFHGGETVIISGSNGTPDYDGGFFIATVPGDPDKIDLYMQPGQDYVPATVNGTVQGISLETFLFSIFVGTAGQHILGPYGVEFIDAMSADGHGCVIENNVFYPPAPEAGQNMTTLVGLTGAQHQSTDILVGHNRPIWRDTSLHGFCYSPNIRNNTFLFNELTTASQLDAVKTTLCLNIGGTSGANVEGNVLSGPANFFWQDTVGNVNLTIQNNVTDGAGQGIGHGLSAKGFGIYIVNNVVGMSDQSAGQAAINVHPYAPGTPGVPWEITTENVVIKDNVVLNSQGVPFDNTSGAVFGIVCNNVSNLLIDSNVVTPDYSDSYIVWLVDCSRSIVYRTGPTEFRTAVDFGTSPEALPRWVSLVLVDTTEEPKTVDLPYDLGTGSVVKVLKITDDTNALTVRGIFDPLDTPVELWSSSATNSPMAVFEYVDGLPVLVIYPGTGGGGGGGVITDQAVLTTSPVTFHSVVATTDLESSTIGNGLILVSPNGHRWRTVINNDGTLSRTDIGGTAPTPDPPTTFDQDLNTTDDVVFDSVVATTDLESSGIGSGLILKSADGTRWRTTIANDGTLQRTSI